MRITFACWEGKLGLLVAASFPTLRLVPGRRFGVVCSRRAVGFLGDPSREKNMRALVGWGVALTTSNYDRNSFGGEKAYASSLLVFLRHCLIRCDLIEYHSCFVNGWCINSEPSQNQDFSFGSLALMRLQGVGRLASVNFIVTGASVVIFPCCRLCEFALERVDQAGETVRFCVCRGAGDKYCLE